MRQAIVTKWLRATNTRGSRIKAIADAGHIVVHWKDHLGVVENHTAAAQALANKLGWLGEWSGGSIPGSGFAFVNSDKADTGFFVINERSKPMQIYSNPKRAADPHALPDAEVFWLEFYRGEMNDETGWYWWACSPGCLPDGDPIGPFATEEEAIADAQSGDHDE